MELLEMMKARQSIRTYSDKKVEKENRDKIAEAGIYGYLALRVVCVPKDKSQL